MSVSPHMQEFFSSVPVFFDPNLPSTKVSGLGLNSKVATPQGWTRITDVQVGDMVMTFDQGPQRVVEIEIRAQSSKVFADSPAEWPVFVPVGAIGNASELLLAPDQVVLFESDFAEDVNGDPFVLIRGADLIGLNGIFRLIPDQPMQLVILRFETEQIIYGMDGVLYHCDAADYLPVTFKRTAVSNNYHPLSPNEATTIIAAENAVSRPIDMHDGDPLPPATHGHIQGAYRLVA